MQIFVTDVFAAAAQNAGIDLTELIEEFKWWKETWDPKKGTLGGWIGDSNCREFKSEFFGKDGANRTPLVEGIAYALRHVHLPPIDEDEGELWMHHHSIGRRKTSNCYLMYASDRYHRHLWLYVLPEPDAHDVIEMRSADDRELMTWMASEAGKFLDGELPAKLA